MSEKKPILGIISDVPAPVKTDAGYVTPLDGVCPDCKYFRRMDEHGGLCHLNPPTGFPYGHFAPVLNKDWCGKFEK